jgi:hypothetical protein
MATITAVWKPMPGVAGTFHVFFLYDDGGNVYYARGRLQNANPADRGRIQTVHGLYEPGTKDFAAAHLNLPVGQSSNS